LWLLASITAAKIIIKSPSYECDYKSSVVRVANE
jgi:hypothetical protein